jgi:hypothetical protein
MAKRWRFLLERSVEQYHWLLLMSPNDKADRSRVAYKSFAHFRVRIDAIRKLASGQYIISKGVDSYL